MQAQNDNLGLPGDSVYHPALSSHHRVAFACAQIHHEAFAPSPLAELLCL